MGDDKDSHINPAYDGQQSPDANVQEKSGVYYDNNAFTGDGVAGKENGSLPGKTEGEGQRFETEEEKRLEKRRILKNIFLISLSFLFNFTSFQGLSRLQSSLHQDEGMGVINSAVLYAALVISCLFLPKIAITKLTHKWCLVVSFCCYILWMGANGIGRWWSMTPTSIFVGLAAAPLWTSQCSYFTKLAVRYAKLDDDQHQNVVTKFFGIFFCFFQMSNIFGSIISSTILNQRPENETNITGLEFCGRNDCPYNNVSNPNLEKPAAVVVWTMVGVFMGVAAIAVLIIIIFMDRLPKELEDQDRPENLRKDISRLLVATLKHLRHKPQVLLIPITMYSGFEQGYFNAEWSKSFISCGLGIWMVGFATLPYGIINACVSFTTGRLVKYTGRIPIFIAGFLVDISIHATLYAWMPNPDEPAVFFIISGMWGFTDAIWQTQINALYGSIFSDESEAAFSNYRMWESLGFIIAFAYSAYICTLYKTIVLTSVLCIGMTGYLTTEYITRKGKSMDITKTHI